MLHNVFIGQKEFIQKFKRVTNSNSNITIVSAVEVISNGLLVAVLKYVEL